MDAFDKSIRYFRWGSKWAISVDAFGFYTKRQVKWAISAVVPAEPIGQQRLLLQLCDSVAAAQEMKFSTVAIIDSLFTVA